MLRRLGFVTVATGALVVACGGGDGAPAPSPGLPALTLPRVSLATPFAAGCDGAKSGTMYANAEVEPFLAINPQDASNLIGSWQQDRRSDGGARGVLAAASFDGGQTWVLRQAPFSRCSGGTVANGGDYERATDPWVSIAPDGTAYWMVLTFSQAFGSAANAMQVSRSTDGGNSWETPVTLIADGVSFFNDKNAVTADPLDANLVYAVWDRLDSASNTGPAYFSRTTDAGDTWESARAIYDPGTNKQSVGNQIVVLPDGVLVDLLTEIDFGPGTATLKAMRSDDQGLTWSVPVTIAALLSIGSHDPNTGATIRDGGLLGAIAVDPFNGGLYVVWQDSRFSAGARDGIAMSVSPDGGLTWSAPAQINAVPQAAAFTPAVRVSADGRIGVSYYDLRDNTPNRATLPTSYWLATSGDAVTWSEVRISEPFDLHVAPVSLGRFLGDYQGLVSSGTDFRAFFVAANAGAANRTDVYTTLLPEVSIAKAERGGYRAAAAPAIVMTPAWQAQLADRVRLERHQFPERPAPKR